MVKSKRPLLVAAMAALAGFLPQQAARKAAAQGPKTDSRPAQHEVVVQKNVLIPMRDGVSLSADLYRPARDGRATSGRFPAP